MNNFLEIPKTQCIIVLAGCPACGKTTLAKEIYANRKDCVIVSRDSIREARGSYNVPEQEDYISDIEEASVRAAIKRGLSPIIDATNLNPKTMEKWEKLSVELDVDLVKKYLYVPFKIAVERDHKRRELGQRSVGLRVLEKFYSTYYPKEYKKEVETDICPSSIPDFSKPPAIIFDLDRTIMYRQGRGIYEYEKASTDYFDPKAKWLIKQLIEQGIKILFVTGREMTVNSISAIHTSLDLPKIHKLDGDYYPYEIIGRKDGDRRSGIVVKEELYESRIKDYYEVIAAFDDDEKVVNMYRSKGIFACKVN